jgi:hypothetical protein
VRSLVDLFFLSHIALQFRTAYIKLSSRVFGRGELVIDTVLIARRYMRCFFSADVMCVLPLPQVMIWKFLHRPRAPLCWTPLTKNSLLSLRPHRHGHAHQQHPDLSPDPHEVGERRGPPRQGAIGAAADGGHATGRAHG